MQPAKEGEVLKVTVIGTPISEREIENYRELARSKFPHNEIEEIKITVDEDFADIDYVLNSPRFQRVRRITGYLSNLSRFNNAKRAEVSDRLQNGI